MSQRSPLSMTELLAHFDGVRSVGENQSVASCPGPKHNHGDRHPSLSIGQGDDGKFLLDCHAGCSIESVVAAAALSMADLFPGSARPISRRDASRRRTSAPTPAIESGAAAAPMSPCTVSQLADAKHLPEAYLRQCGLKDVDRGVRISYYSENGSELPRARLRPNVTAKDSRWWGPKEQPITVYGQQCLPDARKVGQLYLVEGESDCWAGWYHKRPVIGIPGAKTVKAVLKKEHVEGIAKIVVIREPDAGGTLFVENLKTQLGTLGFHGDAIVVELPVKDMSELHITYSDQFDQVLDDAIAKGKPLAATVKDKQPSVPADPPVTKWRPSDITSPACLADIIKSKHRFAADVEGRLYHYVEGLYVPANDTVVQREVVAVLKDRQAETSWKRGLAPDVTSLISSDTPQLWTQPPDDILNVKNGLLNLLTGELMRHSPDHLSTVRCPVDFDPSAECPNWDRFVSDVFPAGAAELAYEIIAFCMNPSMSIQKAIVLYGRGGNGKSVYVAGTRAFLGTDNCSEVGLAKLEESRFATSHLVGKLVNFCSEMPVSPIQETMVFKALTGGDRLEGERKNKPAFSFQPFCKIVITTNHPPKTRDDSAGYYQRLLIVPFERVFRGRAGEIMSDALEATLTSPEELSGVLNRVLVARKRLRENHRFTESAAMGQFSQGVRQLQNPVEAWLERHVLKAAGGFLPRPVLVAALASAASDGEWSAPSSKDVSSAMQKLYPLVTPKQRPWLGEAGVRGWVGLALRDDPGVLHAAAEERGVEQAAG